MTTERFPQESGEFLINSNPIFMLTRGDESEVLVFEATLRVRTAPPLRNTQEKQQVNIEVLEWEARAQSSMLGSDIVMRLSQGRQSPSNVIASTTSSDFPAVLQFNMNYEVVTRAGTMSGLSGTAVGTINAFPPRMDIFQIGGKSLSLENIEMTPIICACANSSRVV